MATTKNDRVYVRVNDEIKEDFETVAEYRGLKTSALLHSLIVKTIHEQRELTPLIFKNKVAGEAGEQQAKQSAASTKDAIAVNVRAKNKSKKAKQTLSTRDGEIPLVDEASSANSDDEQ
jgi:antitoxin component of RelBE/YafQ-DinJ toxin-antitoxin module